MIVGELEASRFDPLDSETVEISAHITNLGDGPSTGPFTVGFTVDGMQLGAVQVDPIEPDGMGTATITAGPLEAGEHLIGVGIDPDEAFEEWDEANNEGEASLTVLRDQVIGLDDSVTVAGPTGSLLSFRVVVEEQLNQPLTVDLSGPNGDGDLYVDFNVVRPSSLFPARFQRRCYSWNVGTDEVCQFYPVREGTYYITVHAYSSFDDATLKVTTGVGPAEDFALELVMVDEGTASQNGIITQVAERYESMIGLGSYDLSLSGAAEVCAPGMPELANEPVDDIKVYVMIGPLDGAGNAVAMSGACYVRPGANGWAGMPALGAIVLDEADVAQLESDGVLEAVVTREMARALGFGPFAWNAHGFLQNPSLPEELPEEPDADTHMNAPLVVPPSTPQVARVTQAPKVPLENGAMEGISDVHWRESVFGNEVMTPYVTGDSQPLSRITLEALYEVGYELGRDDGRSVHAGRRQVGAAPWYREVLRHRPRHVQRRRRDGDDEEPGEEEEIGGRRIRAPDPDTSIALPATDVGWLPEGLALRCPSCTWRGRSVYCDWRGLQPKFFGVRSRCNSQLTQM